MVSALAVGLLFYWLGFAFAFTSRGIDQQYAEDPWNTTTLLLAALVWPLMGFCWTYSTARLLLILGWAALHGKRASIKPRRRR